MSSITPSSGAPLRTADPEASADAKLDAKTQRYINKIASIVAVIVAAISFGAASWSAHIAASTTRDNLTTELSAQKDKERLDRRRETYTQVTKDHMALMAAISEHKSAIDSGSIPRIATAKDRVHAADAVVRGDRPLLIVIGPQELDDPYFDVLDSSEKYIAVVQSFADGAHCKSLSCSNANDDDVHKSAIEADTYMQRFASACRKALGE